MGGPVAGAFDKGVMGMPVQASQRVVHNEGDTVIIPRPPPEPATVPAYSSDSLSKKIAILDLVTTLTYKLAVAAGAIVTLTYLFDIQFFPSSLTPGEVVFFIFVALMFGFLYYIFLLFGAMSALWLLHLLSLSEPCTPTRRAFHGRASLLVVPAGLRGVGYCLVSLSFFFAVLAFCFRRRTTFLVFADTDLFLCRFSYPFYKHGWYASGYHGRRRAAEAAAASEGTTPARTTSAGGCPHAVGNRRFPSRHR